MKKEENTLTVKWKKAEIFCALIVTMIVGLMIKVFYQQPDDTQETYCSLNSGWFQMKDGEQISLSLPGSVTADTEGRIVLYNNALTEKDVGKVLSISGVQNGLEVFMGDKLLYQYQDNKFQKNMQMKGKIWADICLPDDTGEETICLIFESGANSQLHLNAPFLGSYHDIFVKHMKDSSFTILMIVGMLGIGLLSVLIFWYTKHGQITEKRFLDVAVFLILCSLWCILDSGIYQIYGNQNAVGSVVSFYAFMLMSVPMLHFVKNTVSDRVQWIPQMWIFFFYGNAILQGILYVWLEIPYTKMLFVTHIVLFTGVVSMIILLWREYKQKKTMELSFCLNAFSVLGFCGVGALVLYWLFSIYWYDAVFQFGILLYIMILFAGLLRKISEDTQFRLEQAVYEKMSVKDRMTGLKNRKAFEQYLETIGKKAVLPENVLLLFVDIRGLKKINDRYGLHTGDEAVSQVAWSIRMAGNILRQNAECFRIDGNEFAIVVENPLLMPEDWMACIKDEMKMEAGNRYHVRLNFGYSYLKQENGEIYSISDWKMLADRMLHANTEKTVEDKHDL